MIDGEKRYVQIRVSRSMRGTYERDGWECIGELNGGCVMRRDIRVNIGA